MYKCYISAVQKLISFFCHFKLIKFVKILLLRNILGIKKVVLPENTSLNKQLTGYDE